MALLAFARQNMRASLKPTNLRESVWQDTLHRDHEDHIAGKGINPSNNNNLVHKFIPIPQAMKIPDAKAAVDK